MPDEFDPVDPPAPTSPSPLLEYTRPPAGLSAIASLQIVIACLVLLNALLVLRITPEASTVQRVIALSTVPLFALSGLGMSLRRGWGWWLTVAMYFYLFFGVPVALVLWTIAGHPFQVMSNLLVFAVSILVLAYLNRGEVLRFIRFRGPDGRPHPLMLRSPMIAGFAGAVVRMVIELVRG